MPNGNKQARNPWIWTHDKESALAAIRAKTPVREVARLVGVSPTTLNRWAKAPEWLERLSQLDASNAQATLDAERELLESVLSGRVEAVALYRQILSTDDTGKCKECGRYGPEHRDRIAAGRELCGLAREFTNSKTTKLDEMLDAMFSGVNPADTAIAVLFGSARRALNDLLRPQAFWCEGLEVPDEAHKRLTQVLAPLKEALDLAEGVSAQQDEGAKAE